MKNIRHNVFETNSSSSHSISISTDTTGILDTIQCNAEGTITITSWSFGREWEAYNDPITKASYCLSDCRNDSSRQDMLRKVIQEHTGASEVKFIIDSNSYIDHESVGNSDEGFVDEDTLKNLIFNPESYIFTGSDETSPPPNFYDVSKYIVFTHQFEIDECDLVFKFVGIPSAEDLDEAIDSIMERHPLNGYWNHHDYDKDGNQIPFWRFIEHFRNDLKGNKFSSLTKLDNGIIMMFKLKTIYDDDKYLGEEILDTLELRFRIVEI